MSLSRCSSWPTLSLYYTEINNIMYAVKTLYKSEIDQTILIKTELPVTGCQTQIHVQNVKFLCVELKSTEVSVVLSGWFRGPVKLYTCISGNTTLICGDRRLMSHIRIGL